MSDPIDSTTDLLIIGAGPAGLMAASWAAKFKVSTRLIDDKPEGVQKGHADSLTCRSLEILDSFGLAHAILDDCSPDMQMRSWAPASHGGIQRVGTVNVQKPGISQFQQSAINQGRIEHIFQGLLEKEGEFCVERDVQTLELQINETLLQCEGADVRPVAVKIRHGVASGSSAEDCEGHHGRIEILHAKYVIGCDGAHSWTRNQLGLNMKGDMTNAVWGVLDIVPLTNFREIVIRSRFRNLLTRINKADIRQTCVINSKDHGAMHIVPREGRLVRLYVQLAEVDASEGRFDRSNVSPTTLLEIAQGILFPYEIDYLVCDWWSVYQVGQRMADEFAIHNRVFLAGDAIHTHSAKMGQGMNVSMADSYNIGWKICSVIQGILRPSILTTYQSERRGVALALLEADRATTTYYSAREEAPGSIRQDLQSFRDQMYNFLSGVAVEYDDNLLTCRHVKSQCHSSHARRSLVASNIHVGRRMPSHLIILNLASARPTYLSELLRSTGAWRILLFAGDAYVPAQLEKVRHFAGGFVQPDSVLSPHIGKAVEIFTVLSGIRDEVALLSLPKVLHPWDVRLGWDYGKVYIDEQSVDGAGSGNAYASLGIDKRMGCIVVCRPDQHVGFVCNIEDFRGLEKYFAGFLAT